jgi:hypothetical protein
MIPTGTPVDVYWNLHRDCFSVRARSGAQAGRVIAHVDDFTLRDVTFVVGKAGRERVLAEGRKNVHAFVRGEWAAPTEVKTHKVTYDPYRFETFVRASDETPVLVAASAYGIASEGRATIGAAL